jgi:hypothetical protein
VESIALEIGSLKIVEPIPIPYVIGNPVQGQLFVGREYILREMAELWTNTANIQSILLFGHRRMGKTSILRNVNAKLGEKLRLVYVNLQSVGTSPKGAWSILTLLADAIATTLNITPPKAEELSQAPEVTFERYLRQTLATMSTEGLILALDEFEELESLIKEGRLEESFLKALCSWVQMDSRLGFVFAGLHTLEEMQKDYFHPFYGRFMPIRVSFLSPLATRKLLSEPTEDFPLRYERPAVEYIYELTHGQPFLVNLIGYRLVSRFNRIRFEENREISETLTREDVSAVVNEDLLVRGNYYFSGVWNQAAKGAPHQQEILRALCTYPEARDKEEIQTLLNLDTATWEAALKTLKHHDVVTEEGNKVRILVELLRWWLEQLPT